MIRIGECMADIVDHQDFFILSAAERVPEAFLSAGVSPVHGRVLVGGDRQVQIERNPENYEAGGYAESLPFGQHGAARKKCDGPGNRDQCQRTEEKSHLLSLCLQVNLADFCRVTEQDDGNQNTEMAEPAVMKNRFHFDAVEPLAKNATGPDIAMSAMAP